MNRKAMAAGAVGAILGVAALSTMGAFEAPFESSNPPLLDPLNINGIDAGIIRAGAGAFDDLRVGVLDAGILYASMARIGQLDAGSIRTDVLQVGTLDAGSIYMTYLEGDNASLNSLAAGVVDAGSIYAGTMRVGQLDAGSIRADTLHLGTLDAGTMRADLLQLGTLDAGIAWLDQVRNPDGGRLYVPAGLDVDQGSRIGFQGPGGSAFIGHTGGTLALSGGAGKVAVVDGFITQAEATFGQLSANALQCTGGATATQISVVAGTGGPSGNAGIDIFPIDHGTVRVWGDGLRTPQVGNADGGFILRTGLGLTPTPAPYVPLCEGVNIPFGSLIYYNFQWWECSSALASLGATGAWSYPGQPPITFTARTPGDPQGAATAAGIPFNSQNPGTHYTQLGDFVVRVEFSGTCGGGCAAGTNAYYLIVQKNPQDGGYRELARQQIPCTAPQGFCAMVAAPGSTGCVSDGGLFAQALPASMGGLVSLEIRADGGQCSTPPAVSVSGFGFLLMQADGGGA